MRQNTGEAFFHPVTHQLIQEGQFYEGSAHQEFEKVKETIEKIEDDVKETIEEIKDEVKENIDDAAQKVTGKPKKSDTPKDEESK